MRFSRLTRIAAFTACLGGSAVLIGVATGATGAFFTDSESGTIGGNIGSIQINGYGGGGTDGLDMNFSNLLPGEQQTLTWTFENIGANNQDVWMVFPNADALHALNDLGTYGEVHIRANGNPVFESANLNDNTNGTCGPISPAGCWPLPQKVKLFSTVGPGGSGQFSFTFNYGSQLSNPLAQGVPWNAYPVGGPYTGAGLPFQLVATQVGQQP